MLLLDPIASWSKDPQRQKSQRLGQHHLVLVFLALKFLRVLSLYVTTEMVWDEGLPIATLVFWVFIFGSCLCFAFYKPFLLALKSEHHLLGCLYGFMLFLQFTLWFLSIKHLGIFKVVLCSDYVDVVILSALAVFPISPHHKFKSRGLLLIGLGLFIILLAAPSPSPASKLVGDGRITEEVMSRDVREDPQREDESSGSTEEREEKGVDASGKETRKRSLLAMRAEKTEKEESNKVEEGNLEPGGSTFFGICSLFAALAMSGGSRVFQKKIGGKFEFSGTSSKSAKKVLLSLGLTYAALWALLPALYYSYNYPSSGSFLGNGFSFMVITIFAFIGDFLIEQKIRLHFTPRFVTNAAISCAFLACFLLELLWYGGRLISFSAFLGFILFISGLSLLLKEGSLSSSASLPTTSLLLDTTVSTDVLTMIVSGLKTIWHKPDSRKIFIFLVANLSFMFVELAYGWWTNSLGLISDAFHMLFDCMALGVGLYATIMKDWLPNDVFTYGYGRVQVLSGLVNGIFLCFIAISIFLEAIRRLIDPPEVLTERLFLVALLGLIINLIGVYAFHDHAGHGHSHTGHGHSHGDGKKKKEPGHVHSEKKHGDEDEPDENMNAMYLHIVADTLGSLSVVASSVAIWAFNLKRVDPLCSLLISVLIGLSVIPLIKSTSAVLMQSLPGTMKNTYHKMINKIEAVPGVISVGTHHFWQQMANFYVGTVHVEVAGGVSHQEVQKQIASIIYHYGVANTTIQITTKLGSRQPQHESLNQQFFPNYINFGAPRWGVETSAPPHQQQGVQPDSLQQEHNHPDVQTNKEDSNTGILITEDI